MPPDTGRITRHRSRAARPRLFAQVMLSLFVLPLWAVPARTQQVKGVVRDAETNKAVPNAFVSLLDTTATPVFAIPTDSRGRFTLRIPEPGIYAVLAYKEGYLKQTSGWMEVTAKDTFEVTPKLARLATTLTPVLIEAERDSLLGTSYFGQSLKALGGVLMTPTQVRLAAEQSPDIYDLVNSLRVQALRVKSIHIEQAQKGLLPGLYQCIVYSRTNSCVMLVIDGMRFPNLGDQLQLQGLLTPNGVSHMLFLRPEEAGVLFGDGSQNGVLVITTKAAAKR